METGTGGRLAEHRGRCWRSQARLIPRMRRPPMHQGRSRAGRGGQGLRGFRSGRAPRHPARSRLGANFTGAATGEFGPLTFAALKRFEAEAKRPQDGLLTPRNASSCEDGGCGPEGLCLCHRKRSRPRRCASACPRAFLQSARPAPPASRAGRIRLISQRSISASASRTTARSLFERGTANNVQAARSPTSCSARFLRDFRRNANRQVLSRLEKGPDGVLRGFSSVTTSASRRNSTGWSSRWRAPSRRFRARGQQAWQRGGAAAPNAPTRPTAPDPKRVSAVEIAPGKFVTAASAAACKSLALGNAPVTIEKRSDTLLLLAITRDGGKPLPIATSTGSEAILLQRDRAGRCKPRMPCSPAGARRRRFRRAARVRRLWIARARWWGWIEEPKLVTQVAAWFPPVAIASRMPRRSRISQASRPLPPVPSRDECRRSGCRPRGGEPRLRGMIRREGSPQPHPAHRNGG